MPIMVAASTLISPIITKILHTFFCRNINIATSKATAKIYYQLKDKDIIYYGQISDKLEQISLWKSIEKKQNFQVN